MKKNIYLIIISAITVICVIAGSFIHLFGYFSREGGIWTGHSIYPWENAESDTDETVSADKDYGDVNSITVDTSAMDIVFVKGDSVKVSYDGGKKLEPRYSLKDGHLKITQSVRSFNFWNSGYRGGRLKVSIPDDAVLKNTEIDNSAGNIDIRDLRSEETVINTSAGDIEIKDSELGRTDIDTSAGNVKAENSSFTDLNIDASMGDISVSTPQDLSDYSFKMDCSLGDIRLNGQKFGNSYECTGKTDCSVEIDSSLGDIEINSGIK